MARSTESFREEAERDSMEGMGEISYPYMTGVLSYICHSQSMELDSAAEEVVRLENEIRELRAEIAKTHQPSILTDIVESFQ